MPSEWYSIKICANYHERLTQDEIIFADVCPHCAVTHPGYSYVSTKRYAARRITPRWQFWDKRYETRGKPGGDVNPEQRDGSTRERERRSAKQRVQSQFGFKLRQWLRQVIGATDAD